MAYRGQAHRSRMRDSMSQVVAGGSMAQQGMPRPHLAAPPLQQMNAPYLEPSRREEYASYGAQFRSSPYPAATQPMGLPSLSSGQGFYTVESLEGATMLPSAAVPPLPMHELPSSAGHPVGSSSMYHARGNPGLHGQQGGMDLGLGFRERERGIYARQGPYPDRAGPLLPSPNGAGPAFGWPLEREQGRDRNFGWDWNHEFQRERDLWIPESQRFQNHGPNNWRPAPRPASHPKRPASPAPLLAWQSPVPNNKLKKKAPPVPGPGGGTCRCDICDVECNTPDMLQQHLAGKRHSKHVQRLDPDNKEDVSGTTNGVEGNPTENTDQAAQANNKSSESVKPAIDSGKRSADGSADQFEAANKKLRIAEENPGNPNDKSPDLEQLSVSADVGAVNLATSTQPVSTNATLPAADAEVVQLERDKGPGSPMREEDFLLSDISEAKSVLFLDVAVAATAAGFEKTEQVAAHHEEASSLTEKVESGS